MSWGGTTDWSSGTTSWSSGTTGGSSSSSKGGTFSKTGGSSSGSGKAVTSGQATGGGAIISRFPMEPFVRAFESPRILALRARRKALEESEDDSEIIWGRPSQYGSADGTREEDRTGFRIVRSNPRNNPDQPPAAVREYNEIERTEDIIRVTSTTNALHYVDVARLKSVLLRGPDGVNVRFNFTPPPGTPVP